MEDDKCKYEYITLVIDSDLRSPLVELPMSPQGPSRANRLQTQNTYIVII